MASYHINPETGDPGLCRAQPGGCPFGGEERHHSTQADARSAYERESYAGLLSTYSKADQQWLARTSEFMKRLQKSAETDQLRSIYSDAEALLSEAGFSKINRLQEYYRARAEEHLNAGERPQAEANYRLYSGIDELREFRRTLKSNAKDYEEADKALLEPDVDSEKKIRLLKLKAELKADLVNLEKRHSKKLASLFSHKNLVTSAKVKSPYIYTNYSFAFAEPEDQELWRTVGLADEVALGKVTEEVQSESRRKLQATAEELVSAVVNELGTEYLESYNYDGLKEGEISNSQDFVLLGGGAESNVYLHKPSMMVYKLRHRQSLEGSSQDTPYEERLRVAILRIEQIYGEIDSSQLAQHDASYIKTHFLSVEDSSGAMVPVIVQPYLDPKRYTPYDPTYEEIAHMEAAGLDDIHAGNVSIDTRTGKLVLFDCIYVS